MNRLILITLTLCFLMIQVGKPQVPFHRGVNLTGWFQADNAQEIQFRKFKKKDFSDIKSLGCDVIRLPVNLHGMTSGAPDFIIDPLLFSFLDSAVNWAEELQLYLIIDNHSFDPSQNTSPDIGLILNKVWPQLAEHYKNRSNYIVYEVLNEPHGISNQLWGNIQQQSINAIRLKDSKHTIIVGPSGFNSYNDLAQMPVYQDTNLIYTFHFYDPFIFTHQGASWVTPSMEPLSGVPFPYNASGMPVCPPSLLGTWIESGLNNYPVDGTVAKVKSLIDIAINFRNARNVNIFCGEFGVYIPNCDTADRVFWYQFVKDYLEENAIPWTIWDYKGSFGLFKKGSFELFESDLNIPLLEALDFIVPEQHSFMIQPDTTGFRIYDDFLEQGINESSYSTGTIDYYSDLFPNNDKYCLFWSGGPRYTTVSLDFVPDRDLSVLATSGFALDMIVRGNAPGTKFDIRFLDTKTDDPTDHPWRIRTTLAEPIPEWNKRWQHIHVPLEEFTEHGSWDNGSWFNPEGKFDWSAIDRIEIVSEYTTLDNKDIWFDNIAITDQDTATILEKGTLGYIAEKALKDMPELMIYPNPMSGSTMFYYTLTEDGPATISIYNIKGQKITDLVDKSLTKGTYSTQWQGKDEYGNSISNGIYFCMLSTGKFLKHVRLIKS